MNANVDACFALLGRLKSLGITHCVISPGGRSTPLAYVANQLFEASVVIDERAAGFVVSVYLCPLKPPISHTKIILNEYFCKTVNFSQ